MDNTNFKKYLNEPPEYGELKLSFEFEPVSLQSKPDKKRFIKEEIRKVTKDLNYLLSGDIKVEIQWLVFPQERYENAKAPDMDNIIKPILDGLSGPSGIIIDDCQVQSIGSHWIDWNKKEHLINISIQYNQYDYLLKENLVFVNMGDNLFLPFHTDNTKEVNRLILSSFKRSMNARNLALKKNGSYYMAKIFMPIQRVFHKSRINESFDCKELNEFENDLK